MVYVEPIGTGDSARLSPDDGGYSLDRYVGQMQGLVNHLGERVYVLGHSHGGFVMQRYALREPARVAGLISYCSSPRWGDENRADVGRQLDRMAVRLDGRPELSAVVKAAQDEFEPTDEGFTAYVRAILPAYFADYWGDEETLAPMRAALRAWLVPGGLADFDDRDALRLLPVPTLVLTGRHDFICGPRWAVETTAAVPGARLTTFADSGHMPHIEEPGRFAATVRDFVGSGAVRATG